ncbi:MAG TPA: ABC-type transport auxiliary lipoprotein family protein [Candidatus Binatia bacterium]|nr:ABC-type transport auxiliary lipoprotein family protein [Candidatus Binatia bacterium]
MRPRALALLGLAVLEACLARSADRPRFFRPTSALLDAVDAVQPVGDGVPIRLREVRADPFLRERIVWRISDVEYGSYEQRRWLDLPAHYVDRALAVRLQATPGLRLTDDLAAMALYVDILAFDDVLAPQHEANVTLAVALEDRTGVVLLRRTVEARVAVASDDPAALAKAMGEALDQTVAQVADGVRESALRRPDAAGGRAPRSSRPRSAR